MFNQVILFTKSAGLDFVLKVLLSTALLCLLSPLSLEIQGQLPVTMQTFAVILVAVVFGWKIGVTSVLVYCILGAVGLPVFPGYESGTDRFLGPAAGFYFAFLIAAGVCGYWSEKVQKLQFLNSLLIWLSGHVLIVILGFGWMWSIIPPETGLVAAFKPYIPGLMIKVGFGIITVHIISRIVQTSLSNKT